MLHAPVKIQVHGYPITRIQARIGDSNDLSPAGQPKSLRIRPDYSAGNGFARKIIGDVIYGLFLEAAQIPQICDFAELWVCDAGLQGNQQVGGADRDDIHHRVRASFFCAACRSSSLKKLAVNMPRDALMVAAEVAAGASSATAAAVELVAATVSLINSSSHTSEVSTNTG